MLRKGSSAVYEELWAQIQKKMNSRKESGPKEEMVEFKMWVKNHQESPK
jgi:trehalose/maltose hydrolase-like predicted phosphorylase